MNLVIENTVNMKLIHNENSLRIRESVHTGF